MSGNLHWYRGLTLTQPWAGLVASGVKRIENRDWRPPRDLIGTDFVIHASRKIDPEVTEGLLELGLEQQPSWTPTSSILAVATLYDFVTTERGVEHMMGKGIISNDQLRFFMGPVAFVLTNIRELVTPIPCKGNRKFWVLPPDLNGRVRDAIADRAYHHHTFAAQPQRDGATVSTSSGEV